MNPDVNWHAFDPQEPGSPPPSLDGTGAIAVVPAGDPQWAASAAVALARALARSGRRVFLCDAGVEEPRLDGFFDDDFGEGVSDLVLYGASPRRVATEVEERLLFVAAGTTVADPARVRSSPRWDALVDAVAQAEGVLLLHLPAEVEGADALLARAERVVVAGDPDVLPELGEASDRLVLGLHPAGAHLPAAPAVPAATEPGSEAVHGLPAEVAEEGADAGPPEPGPPSVHIPSGAEVETPSTADGDVLDDPRVKEAVSRARSGEPTPQEAGGGGRTLLLILLLVVVALLVAAFMGVLEIPGITPAQAGAVVEAAPEPPPGGGTSEEGAAAEVQVVAPHHRWNVMLGSYADAASAAEVATRLSTSHPDLSVIVAPVEVEGREYHRILAGPVSDSAAAEVLRPLVGGEAGEGVVRPAPLAFLVGESRERSAAERRREVLAELDVPAHILALARSDGSTLFRVYVGAYADAREAAFMEARLRDRNVENAPLVDRLGTPPA
jgi:hypothetical protein